MLEGEHATGATEADRHFVENEQCAVTIAGIAHDSVVLRRWNLYIGRAHGFDHYRADVLFLRQNVVDIFRTAQVAGLSAAESAIARIAGRDVLGSRQQRSDVPAENSLASDRDGMERSAVERVPERQRLVAAGDQPCNLERHADRQCAPGRERDLAERFGDEACKLLGQSDRGIVGEAARRERQRIERALHRLDHVRVAIADLMHVVAVEIHDSSAFDIFQPDAVAGLERVEAWRRERLVQEIFTVGIESRARRGAHVTRLPGAAQRGKIDVALDGKIGTRQWLVHFAGHDAHHGSE